MPTGSSARTPSSWSPRELALPVRLPHLRPPREVRGEAWVLEVQAVLLAVHRDLGLCERDDRLLGRGEVARRALLRHLEATIFGVDERPRAGHPSRGSDLRVVLEEQQVVALAIGSDHVRQDLHRRVG